MNIRSTLLFAHVVGVLLLFVAIALEWVSNSSGPTEAWTSVRTRLPRLYGFALGLTLLTGLVLSARVGVHGFAWVRLALGGIVVMGIIGAISGRRAPGHPFIRVSLLTRTAMALAIVYLMIAKPETVPSLIVMGAAIGVALFAGMTNRKAVAW